MDANLETVKTTTMGKESTGAKKNKTIRDMKLRLIKTGYHYIKYVCIESKATKKRFPLCYQKISKGNFRIRVSSQRLRTETERHLKAAFTTR